MAAKGTSQNRDLRRGAANTGATRQAGRSVKPNSTPSPKKEGGSDYPNYDRPGPGSNKGN
jgi:hypothetical protein